MSKKEEQKKASDRARQERIKLAAQEEARKKAKAIQESTRGVNPDDKKPKR